MMSQHTEKFSFPVVSDAWSLSDSDYYDDKVCVVAVVGKSVLNDYQSKASIINPVVGCTAFTGPQTEGSSSVLGKDDTYRIEGFYNPAQHVIYLHLWGVYDTNVLADLCQRAANNTEQKGSLGFLNDAECDFARALLFVFSVSHIVMLHQPGSSFSMSLVRYLRVLDIVRQKVQPKLTEVLRTVPGLGKEWQMSGRPCAPRVLFLFPSCSVSPEEEGKANHQAQTVHKKLQHAMEDQIYRILRKSRVITNISNNSLFAVPANQEFVFLGSDERLTNDPTSFYLNQLLTFSSASQHAGHSYQASRRPPRDFRPATHHPTDSKYSTNDRYSSPSSTSPLKDFLWQHIDLALTRGFDDNVGRNPVPAVFELPTLELWADASQAAHDFFLGSTLQDMGSKSPLSSLRAMLDIDLRFSEGRCAKVQALAEQTYQEGLPSHYTQAIHLNKLGQARQVLLQHARGPACPRYLLDLEKHCNEMWKDRQLCEHLSLTGNHCRHALHRLPEDMETEENRLLPVMPHSSQVKTRAACNCGRKQTEREDPYDCRAANHDFYKVLAAACCDTLEKYELPVFKGSSDSTAATSAAAVATTGAGSETDEATDSLNVHKLSIEDEISQGQSVEGDMYSNEDQITYNPDASQDTPTHTASAVAMTAGEDEGEEVLSGEALSRQHSTTEYLAGMVHSDRPPGLLPQFSSWSLINLGRPTSYNPSIGIDQPGFLHGGSFLLPWDVPLKSDKEHWPSVGGRKYKPKKSHRLNEGGDSSVRLYIGFEYECPRGHRYLLSSPDKIFRAPISGIFKETAFKVLNQPMPLYSSCHCRATKGFMGQLMRVFLVVPESPLMVQLSCRIQPAPPPCPVFQPSSEGPIKLEPGLWVLRLPFVYMGDDGPYLMPKDHQLLPLCKVMKGIVTSSEVSDK